MNFPKFILKEDWYIETKLLNQVTKELVFEKGHIFETETGLYDIVWTGGKMSLSEKMMRESQDENKNSMFDEIPVEPKQELKFEVQELTEDEDLEVKRYRIQLDVTTNRKKLREIENFMRKTLEEML
jgi:hypothetical protein